MNGIERYDISKEFSQIKERNKLDSDIKAKKNQLQKNIDKLIILDILEDFGAEFIEENGYVYSFRFLGTYVSFCNQTTRIVMDANNLHSATKCFDGDIETSMDEMFKELFSK